MQKQYTNLTQPYQLYQNQNNSQNQSDLDNKHRNLIKIIKYLK